MLAVYAVTRRHWTSSAHPAALVDKDHFLLRYDLESGEKVELMSLYRDDGILSMLYNRFHAAFSSYRPSFAILPTYGTSGSPPTGLVDQSIKCDVHSLQVRSIIL